MKINPLETDVFGWDRCQTIELLICIMVAMKKEIELPPVDVCTFDNGRTYHLPFQDVQLRYGSEGGHTRMTGARLFGIDYLVNVVEATDFTPPLIPIPGALGLNELILTLTFANNLTAS